MPFKDEVYPNSPLAEVVFETRFPSDLEVECERYKFWRKIRDDYPKILVPKVSPEKAPALQHYQFSSEDGKAKVMAAINSIGYSVTEYDGYQEFSKRALQIQKTFSDTFSLKEIKSVGWRYINIIPYARGEDGLIPLQDYLKIGLNTPPSLPEQYRALSLLFQVDTDDTGGLIMTRLQAVENEEGQEAILLDIDYIKEKEGMRFGKLDGYMKDAHACARQLFEDLVTDEYRLYLQGETI